MDDVRKLLKAMSGLREALGNGQVDDSDDEVAIMNNIIKRRHEDDKIAAMAIASAIVPTLNRSKPLVPQLKLFDGLVRHMSQIISISRNIEATATCSPDTSPQPVEIAKDGRCECTCGTPCPLGKAGMSYRFTKAEFEAARIPYSGMCKHAK